MSIIFDDYAVSSEEHLFSYLSQGNASYVFYPRLSAWAWFPVQEPDML